jgi:hypothetical protein
MWKFRKTGANTKKDRFELPNIWRVHFFHDHLDRGVNSSSTYDFLEKHVAEFLRCRHVDLRIRFLNRGKLCRRIIYTFAGEVAAELKRKLDCCVRKRSICGLGFS